MWQKLSKIFIGLTGIITLLTAVVSCDNGCEQVRESFMHICFTGTTSRSLRSLMINAHGRREGIALGDSTTLQYSFEINKFDNIELELNPQDSLVTFVIRSDYQDYGDQFKAYDTIRVRYTANGRFLDMDCGCTVDYEINDITSTHNFVEDIRVLESQIHTESGINLELIY